MPTTPTVIPLIAAGLMLGSLLVSGKRKMSKKKLLGVSFLGGLLNAANAFIVYTLFPPTSFSRFSGGNFGGGTFTGSSTFQFRGGGAAGATSESSFIILSFITGLLIVIVVVGVALLYVRYKSRHLEEEAGEAKPEEEQEELEEPEQKEQEEI